MSLKSISSSDQYQVHQQISQKNTEESETDYSEVLPPEIWLRIFSFLAYSDLGRISLQSRSFYQIASYPLLWKVLFEKTFGNAVFQSEKGQNYKKKYEIEQKISLNFLNDQPAFELNMEYQDDTRFHESKSILLESHLVLAKSNKIAIIPLNQHESHYFYFIKPIHFGNFFIKKISESQIAKIDKIDKGSEGKLEIWDIINRKCLYVTNMENTSTPPLSYPANTLIAYLKQGQIVVWNAICNSIVENYSLPPVLQDYFLRIADADENYILLFLFKGLGRDCKSCFIRIKRARSLTATPSFDIITPNGPIPFDENTAIYSNFKLNILMYDNKIYLFNLKDYTLKICNEKIIDEYKFPTALMSHSHPIAAIYFAHPRLIYLINGWGFNVLLLGNKGEIQYCCPDNNSFNPDYQEIILSIKPDMIITKLKTFDDKFDMYIRDPITGQIVCTLLKNQSDVLQCKSKILGMVHHEYDKTKTITLKDFAPQI